METPRLLLPDPPSWLMPAVIPEPYTLLTFVDLAPSRPGTVKLIINLQDADPLDQPALDEEAVRRGCLESVRFRVGPRSWAIGLEELSDLGLIHRQELPGEGDDGPRKVIWCLWRIGGAR